MDNKSNSNVSNMSDFTLLIYMIASNLENEAADDIKEMMEGNLTNPNVNVIVQTGGGKTDKFSNIQIQQILNNQSIIKFFHKINGTDKKLGTFNMGDKEILADFIKWGISNFPAKRYGLILWDHGGAVTGYGADMNFPIPKDPKVKHDLLSGKPDALHLSEMKSIKDTLISDINFENLEFIGFDSCLMGTIEVATVLSSNTPLSKYLIASEEIIPNWGWNYTTIVDSISRNSSISGDLLGKNIIESYIEHSTKKSKELKFNADRDITLSVIDLTKIIDLNTRMDELITKLRDNKVNPNPKPLSKLLKSIDITEKFGQGASNDYKEENYGMIDIFDFLNNLGSSFPSIKRDTDLTKKEIDAAIIYNYSGKSHPNSKGISIYLPVSVEQFQKMEMRDFSGDKIPPLLYSQTWNEFINEIKNYIESNKYSPLVLESAQNNNSINISISNPDIKSIFLITELNSSNNTPIAYFHRLDPALIDEEGIFRYDKNKNQILALCNETEDKCIPASSNNDITKNSTKYFIKVEIKGKAKELAPTLIYEFQNGEFIFLGGVEQQFQIKGGGDNTIQKNKISIEKGDRIYTQGLYTKRIVENNKVTNSSYHFNKSYMIEDSSTVYDRILAINTNVVKDEYLNVIDPSKIKPKMINIKESSMVRFLFCDYLYNCESSRPYNIDHSYDVNQNIYERPYIVKSLLFNSFNSQNYLYINQIYNFQLEYPKNWFSITQDIYDDTIDINDPVVVSLYPEDEVQYDNRLQYIPHITISVEDISNNIKNPNSYLEKINMFNSSYNIDSNIKNKKVERIKNFINNISAIKAMFEIEQTSNMAHYFGIIINGKYYTIGFESDKAKFEKYLSIVKNIINSFKPIEFDEEKLNKFKYRLIDEKVRFQDIKNSIEKQFLNYTKWIEYKDYTNNFKITLPYINKNNQLNYIKTPKCQGGPTNECSSMQHAVLPSFFFIDEPKIPLFKIRIYNESKISEHSVDLKEKLQLNQFKDIIGFKFSELFDTSKITNYNLSNSYLYNLSNFVSVVDEASFFFSTYRDLVKSSHLYTVIDDKFISLSLISPYNDPNHKPWFNKIIKSFKLTNK